MALPISRRTVLRGAGAAMALPLLESMLPRSAWAAPEKFIGNRMAFVYIPNGAIMQHWTPQQVGANFSLPKTLQPLQSFQKDMLVLSGLAHDKARANGDGAGDHARDSAAFLTGAQPRKSDSDIYVGQSVDQYAAERIGTQTRFPSLELGIESGRQAGRCDSGYGCAYQSNISWRTPTTPMAKEINPRAVFERLFGKGDGQRAQAKRMHYRKSILDFVAEDAKALTDKVGGSDRRKLDEYFTSVREIEERLDRATADQPQVSPLMPTVPESIPDDWADHVRLMYDLMVAAFQTDSTRIITFMLANSSSNRSYKEIGVPDAHHELSHHRNDQQKMNRLQKVDQYMIDQFAYFLQKLKNTKEGDGTLLDHSMILYGCSISDANRHAHHDLPVLLAGGGNGTLKPGRHIRYEKETPMTNLFLSMLDKMQVEAGSFGDSTGRAAHLDG